jgi:small subunit ribosomal protein S6
MEKRMQRTYEVMFIVRPDLAEEEIDKLISNLEGQATSAGATVKNTEKMGKRRLAYVVRKFNDGFYILLTVDADGKAIHEIERRLRVADPVIKFISVRIDEEQKRLEKIKQIRATKVKRSTSEPAPAAAEAVPVPAATA